MPFDKIMLALPELPSILDELKMESTPALILVIYSKYFVERKIVCDVALSDRYQNVTHLVP